MKAAFRSVKGPESAKKGDLSDVPVTEMRRYAILFAEVIEMINKTTFGAFIRAKRTEKGLTQKELADLLFLSESAVSKWEKGKSYPDITMIPSICDVLDVSERELIQGAEDTEFRRIKRESVLYRRISESFFWGFTAAYAAAFLICLICDLAANGRITFSPVVFGALLVAFSFIPTFTRFSEKHKAAVFVSSTYLSLAALFAICCLRFRQNWFGTASSGVLLGWYTAAAPFGIRRLLPEKARPFGPGIYFGGMLLCVLLLLAAVRVTTVYPLGKGVLIALYCFLPFAVISLAHLLRTNRPIRAAVDVFASGLTLYGLTFVIDRITGIPREPGFYSVDFSDWTAHVNGNVMLLCIAVSAAVSLALLIAGIVSLKKSGREA